MKKKHGEVKENSTLTESIRSLGKDLQDEGVKKVAMESTGIYWIPVWNIILGKGKFSFAKYFIILLLQLGNTILH